MNNIIVCNKNIMLGKPCIKGTRITVECVLELLSTGASFSEITLDYPSLNERKILACIAYASKNLKKGNAA